MKIMSTIAENLIHFALTRGIIYGIKPIDKIPVTGFAVHAPFTLEPYKYPQKAFYNAVELAPIFNNLVDKISRDSAWLNSVLTSTASSDSFTSKLLEIMNVIEKEGGQQEVNLGIIRSDYMLHDVPNDPRCILQVEINTVASSFGSLSTKISDMHSLFYKDQNIPKNHALTTLSESLAYAHFKYLSQAQSANAVVVMVVQHGERNFADQRHLDFTLLELFGVRMVRLSLDEIHLKCSLDETTRALMYEGLPVSVVYVSFESFTTLLLLYYIFILHLYHYEIL